MKDEYVLIEKSYDTQAKQYDELFVHKDPFFDFEYKMLEQIIKKPSCILDLGCGTGRHSIYLAQKGNDVTWLDLSSWMLNQARENAKKAQVNINFIKWDMSELSRFWDASFDYIISLYQSFGYVPTRKKRQKTINEVIRILKPGWKIILDVWNILFDLRWPKYWWFLGKTCLGLIGKDLEFGDNISEEVSGIKTYSHIFTPWELKKYFKQAGFKKIEINFIDRSRGEVKKHILKSLCCLGIIVIAEK